MHIEALPEPQGSTAHLSPVHLSPTPIIPAYLSPGSTGTMEVFR